MGVNRPVRRSLAARPAAAALVALSLAAACSADGDGATATAPATSAAPDRTVVDMVPAPGTTRPVTAGWVDAGADPEVFGPATVTDAITVDQRLVAVGCKRTVAGSDLAIWTSTDGMSWQRATAPDGLGGDGAAECLTDVVATPVGIFAHGQVLLRSVDGTAWKEVPVLGPAGQPAGWVGAVFPRADGVAVLTHSASLNESTEAHLWTSTDGVTFAEVAAGPADVFDNAAVSQVLEVGSGLVAVGASPWGEFVPTATVWTSNDGLRWERVTPNGNGFADAYIQAVTAAGDGYLAVGGDPFDTGLLAAWVGSADGRTWQRLPPPDEVTDPEVEMGRVAYREAVAVTVIDGVAHVAGHDYDARRSPGDQDRTALWTSADGVLFRSIDPSLPDGLMPFTVARLGDRLVGFWPPPRWLDDDPVRVLTAPAPAE